MIPEKRNSKKKNSCKSFSPHEKRQKEYIEILNQFKSKNNVLFSNNNLYSSKINQINSYFILLLKYKLSQKYNSQKQTYNKNIINILIKRKHGKILAKFKDLEIYNNIQEFLKRFYHIQESIIKIPKYAIYYKNYSLFFCRPTLSDFICNKIMNKHMQKNAQIFFDKNYLKKNKEQKKIEEVNNKTNNNIFNKKVIEEIEIEEISKKKMYNTGFNSFDKETSFFKDISNINPFPKTTFKLNDLKDFKIKKPNNYLIDTESTLSNSIHSILSILTNNKKEKIQYNIYSTPKKKNYHHISSNSSMKKSSQKKSSNKNSSNKGLVIHRNKKIQKNKPQKKNSIYNSNNKRSFHHQLSSFISSNESNKKINNKKLNSPSNLKNVCPLKSVNTTIKNNFNNYQNLLKQSLYDKNSNYKSNSSPLKSSIINNIKTPIDLYLSQSKLFKSPIKSLRHSFNKIDNKDLLKASRNSNINTQNSSKKITKKSSIEDNTISFPSRNSLRNSQNNLNKKHLNKNNNFYSVNKNNHLTKNGKLVFPNQEISTKANSNDYNKIKPHISLLTFC